MSINPFIYGCPVKPREFYNREGELSRILGRLSQGQSTSIIGQPHIGKTSLLNVMEGEGYQEQILGQPLKKTILRFIDSHMLGREFTQHEFWSQVLKPVSIQIRDENVQDLYAIAQENHFGTFTLEEFFAGLDDVGWKVAILLDEFDALLSHPILNSTEFYGSLRSLASRFDSLTLVIASRRSLSDLNTETQKLNPHGSPYFNIFTEQRIGAFPQEAAQDILTQPGVNFSLADRDFVLEVSGRHPYLLQLTAGLLWDYRQEHEEDRAEVWVEHDAVANQVYDQAQAHFDDTWRTWSNAERKVITAIALAQIPMLVEGHEFKWQALIHDIEDYSPELRTLTRDGTVEEVVYFDGATGWAITQQALLWWLGDTIKREVRDDKSWAQWLEAQEFGAVLTQEERSRIDEAAKRVRDSIGRGASTLIEAFVKGAGSGLAKSVVG